LTAIEKIAPVTPKRLYCPTLTLRIARSEARGAYHHSSVVVARQRAIFVSWEWASERLVCRQQQKPGELTA